MGFSSKDIGSCKLIKYFRDLSNGERTALMSKETASREKIQLILEALALDPFQVYWNGLPIL